jgi:uncharacterized membrane protein YcaP (DUF421 family)
MIADVIVGPEIYIMPILFAAGVLAVIALVVYLLLKKVNKSKKAEAPKTEKKPDA